MTCRPWLHELSTCDEAGRVHCEAESSLTCYQHTFMLFTCQTTLQRLTSDSSAVPAGHQSRIRQVGGLAPYWRGEGMKAVLGNDMQLGCTEFAHAYRAEAVLDIFKISAFCCCIKSRIQRQSEKGAEPIFC